MSRSIPERLLDCIGKIEDFFVEEAETAGNANAKTAKRKRIVKYSAYGVVGVAVAIGVLASYRKIRSNRTSKTM